MFGAVPKESSTMRAVFLRPMTWLGLVLFLCLGAYASGPLAAEESPLLGVLLLDRDWKWTPRTQEGLSLPAQPGLVHDWQDLLDPGATRNLTVEQKAHLLANPRRLLASQHRTTLFRPGRLLLITSDDKTAALQIDLTNGARQILQAPTKVGRTKARETLIRMALEGRGPEPVPVVVNSESQMYHLPGARHLSPRIEVRALSDRTLAEQEGLRPCPICFPETNRLVGQDELERRLAQYAAGMIEDRYRVSQDPEERSRVFSVGERLMQSNRFADQGYRFVVLDSDELNAFSVPTGPIYVTSGLLKALETPDELAAILAHELTHAENHHMRRQYDRSQWSGMIGSVLGYATRSFWGRVAGNFLADTFMKGYSRDFELEADRGAVLMTFAAGYRPEDFALTLTKLGELSRQLGQWNGPDWFATHPSWEGRVRQVREMVQKLAPLEDQVKALEAHGDGELAGYLRRQASSYLANPDELHGFLEAYGSLELELQPGTSSPPSEPLPDP
jgi:hypothetical protein